MQQLSFLESEESSEDDEVNSLDHRMTNEAIVATSAGGLSKSGMGRAAALGMDVGSVEPNTEEHLQTKSRNSQFQPSLILRKKMTSLVKKTKETRELLSSKQFFGRQKPFRQNNESLGSDEIQSIASEPQSRNARGADLFSIDALASQRSCGTSLVNKLGMATEVSSYLVQNGSQSSHRSLGLQDNHNQQCEPAEKQMKAGQICRPASATESYGPNQLGDHDGDEAVLSDTKDEDGKPEVPLQELQEEFDQQLTKDDAPNRESATTDRSSETTWWCPTDM
eukprot:CAMPEP_0113601206 /NCGR_PEP_ID=MMETSP0017_2-20120614/107_1 /TAXON_ID=2856 /ORGANISM="Cylindrotheca closterium" /LENGTH=279 /DNA_ID=CAMNT_0000509487 /DNA_START=985 /DNA_END=1824 /DNA_ORIENTATION=+ /assembly_acc=CAM_ASM_000147